MFSNEKLPLGSILGLLGGKFRLNAMRVRLASFRSRNPLYSFDDFLDFPASVSEPISGPYPVYIPTQIFQNHLPKTVAITRRFRGVIACPIAFYAENESPRLFGMSDGDINEESRHADLG